MLPIIWAAMRQNAPILMLPLVTVVGLIGYKIEGYLSNKYTPYKPSTEEQRDERQLQEIDRLSERKESRLVDKTFVPKSIFEKNLSPGLQ